MGRLKVLPASIANMIAAGEVVQRPASVVKELMENAVDAGASRVDVVIADSGRTLIRVVDDGCGMSPSDAVLCFERHATSKIARAADLEAIATYGFRGEALASIAAVSEVTLRTRRPSDETASQVVISGGELRTSSVSAPVGSSFTVRNLFYNTPARRKFLKSDAIEFKHIVEEFTRIAIPRPNLAFTLTHNDREVFVLRPAKGLKFRILDLLGKGVVGDILDLSADTSIVRISGFAGRPESARKALGNQYFFVDGRFFRSPYLHKAVMKAYEEFVPQGLTPPYFIFLDVAPGTVDVNIHPTKQEIKFEDEGVFFQVLYACVREALGKGSFSAGIDFNNEGAVEFPAFGSKFSEYNPVTAHPDPVASAPYKAAPYMSGGLAAREDFGVLFDAEAAPDCILVRDKYLVSRSASGLMIVNVRRAWERIAYQRALASLGGGAPVTQTALFPVQVQVGVQERLIFDANLPLLRSLGFDISPSGPDSVCVGGVPEGLSCEPGRVEAMVADLLLILSDGGAALEEVMRQKTAAKFAMLSAANSAVPATPAAQRQLLDTLLSSDNAEFTPNGKRIIAVLGLDELDKLF